MTERSLLYSMILEVWKKKLLFNFKTFLLEKSNKIKEYVNTCGWESKVNFTFGNLLSSSTNEMIFMGRAPIRSKVSWLSMNSMCFQPIPSLLYSSYKNEKKPQKIFSTKIQHVIILPIYRNNSTI